MFIHRRTNLVEPNPRAIKKRTGSNESIVLSAESVCKQIAQAPSLATHAIFLMNNKSALNLRNPLSINTSAEAFTLLIRNHIYVGSRYSEGVITFAHLSKKLKTATLFHDGYESLMASVDALVKFVDGNTVNGQDPFT